MPGTSGDEPQADRQLPAIARFVNDWWGPILIVVAALGMLTWTWGTWPDVLIDFGHERYVPWRLAQGEVLYRDIALYNGPLSQYFNALCFRIFGASLRTLVFCNLAILAALVLLLYYVMRQVSHRLTAIAACMIFVLLFAFAQYDGITNYSYVCPYAHEVTHGLVLSLAAVVAAWPTGRYRVSLAALSGLALGLAFLTKAELFLPAAVATLLALAMGIWWGHSERRQTIARLSCFLLAFALPPVLAFLCLASAMPAHQALTGTLGSWVVAMRSDVTGLPFFREGMGTAHPLESLWTILVVSGLYAVILVPAGLLGLKVRRPDRYRTAIAVAVFFAVAGLLWYWRDTLPWLDIARPFPLLILLAAVAVVLDFLPHRHEDSARYRLVRRMSLLVFATLLLGKMFLNTHITHYGFVLSMPASLLLSAAALDWVPALIDRRGGSGRVFMAAAAAILLVAGQFYLGMQANRIDSKTVPVGTGADSFLAGRRGECVNAVVARIASQASPDTTLAVLPEGAIINCLTGLRNPTPYPNLTPIQVILFGEDRICQAFRTHPPDLIVLVQRDSSEFGFPFFGRDYARQLGDWIRANYRQSFLIGAMPFQGSQFGILLLERNNRADKAGTTNAIRPRG